MFSLPEIFSANGVLDGSVKYCNTNGMKRRSIGFNVLSQGIKTIDCLKETIEHKLIHLGIFLYLTLGRML